MNLPRTRTYLRLLHGMLVAFLLAGSGLVPAARPAPAPEYFWHPEIAPAGPLVIVASLDEQRLYVYRNGVAIGISPISSGRKGYETPTGVYTILQKEREHRSNLYEDAPMPYMQRLTWDGVALHAGTLPGHAASHGCIRLPQAFAGKLFEATRRGDVVVVASALVAPAAIVHPSAVAPIDLNGRPMIPEASAGPAFPAPGGEATGPVSIIVSTSDRTAYVLRNGELVAHAPVTVAGDAGVHGTLLYVMGTESTPAPGQPDAPRHHWTGYRILGAGTVPEPQSLARKLKLPRAFGKDLRAMLHPGATVLVTDLPGYGPTADSSHQTLLQSAPDTQTGKR